jgi:hypothetical protein
MTISRRQMLMGSVALPFCGILPDLQLDKNRPNLECSGLEDVMARYFINSFIFDYETKGYVRKSCGSYEGFLNCLKNMGIYEDKSTFSNRRHTIYGQMVIHEPVHELISSGQSYIIRDIVHVIDWGFQYKASPEKVISRCYKIIEEISFKNKD